MKKTTFTLVLITSFFISLIAKATVTDVNADLSKFETSSGGPSLSTGALNLSIPLLTVPARKMSFPLNIRYKAGIKQEEEASEVGLGWILNPGMITQIVNNIPDDAPGGILSNNPSADKKDQDTWIMSINGDSHQIIFDENGIGYFQNWKPWKIEYEWAEEYEFISPLLGYTGRRIKSFRITKEDGTVYIFGSGAPMNYSIDPMFGPHGTSTDDPPFNGWYTSFTEEDKLTHAKWWTWDYVYGGGIWTRHEEVSFCNTRPCKKYYSGTWLLTEIHSPDYVDTNSNGRADNDDYGDWIRFIYADHTPSECYATVSGHTVQSNGCHYFFPPVSNGTGWDDVVENIYRNWEQAPSRLNDGINDYTDLFGETYFSINTAIWAPYSYTTIDDPYGPDHPQGYEAAVRTYKAIKTEKPFILLDRIETPTHIAEIITGQRKDLRSVKMNELSHAPRIDEIKLKRRGFDSYIQKSLLEYDESYPLCSNAPGSTDSVNNGKLTLKSVKLCGANGNCMPKNEFEYANNDLPGTGLNLSYSGYCYADKYGYHKDTPSCIPEETTTNDPNDFAKSWSLTAVKHAGGGRTAYEYGLNTFNTFSGGAVGGGIRVEKITSSDGLNNSYFRRYDYINGAVIPWPIYLRSFEYSDEIMPPSDPDFPYGVDYYVDYMSDSYFITGLLGNEPTSRVQYSNVREIHGETGYNNGFIEYDFTNLNDYPDENCYPSIGCKTSNAWKRGAAKAKRIYNSTGSVVSDTTYTYTMNAQNYHEYLDGDEEAISCGGDCEYTPSYRMISGWVTLASETKTEDGITVTTNYGNYNPVNGRPTKITTESNGKSKIKETTFCDVINCDGSAACGQYLCEASEERHILNITYKTWIKEEIDGEEGVTGFNRYTYHIKNGNRIYPNSTFTWVDSNMDGLIGDELVTSSNDAYDNYGNVLQKTDPRGIGTTFVYDPSRQYSVLQSSTTVDKTTQYLYEDSRFNTPTRITYPDNTFESMSYDEYGILASTISTTGATTTNAYHVAGTITELNLNYEQTTTAVNDGTVRQSIKLADGLGREIIGAVNQGSYWIKNLNTFDVLGNPEKAFYPFTSGILKYEIPSGIDYAKSVYESSDPRNRIKEQYPNYSSTPTRKTVIEHSNSGTDTLVTITKSMPSEKITTSSKEIFGLSASVNVDGIVSSTIKNKYKTTTIDAEGKVTVFWYDNMGNKRATSRPDMNPFYPVSYPDLIDPDTNSTPNVTEEYEYDEAGNLVLYRDSKMCNPNANKICQNPQTAMKIVYNAFGKEYCRGITHDGITLQVGTEIKTYYDVYTVCRYKPSNSNSIGKTTCIKNESEEEVYVYDSSGLITEKRIYYEEKEYIYQYSYNNIGELTLETIDPVNNLKARYVHNNLGQIYEVYLIDKDNQEMKVAEIQYNIDGMIEAIIRTDNGLTTAYTYDSLKRLYKIRNSSIPGFNRFFEHDDLDRIRKIYDGVDNTGLLIGDFSSSGSCVDINGNNIDCYDSIGRLYGGIITSSMNNDIHQRLSFGYDRVGNRQHKSIYNIVNGEWEQDFLDDYQYYGSTNRLLFVTKNQSGISITKSFEYDPNGNIEQVIGLNNNITNYTYDYYNNLKIITLPNGKEEKYSYNSAGKRIKKTDSLGREYEYIYSGNDASFDRQVNLKSGDLNKDNKVNVVDLTMLVGFLFGGQDAPEPIEIANVNGDLENKVNVVDLTYLVGYLFGGGPPPPEAEGLSYDTAYLNVGGVKLLSISQGDVNSIKYYLTDQLGSSSVVLDKDGKETGRQEYYPFGSTLNSNGTQSYTNQAKYQFTGKENDDAGKSSNSDKTGLYYYGARFYDPEIGRFMARDIVDDPANQNNPYSYVSNNPINAIDPTGHWFFGIGSDGSVNVGLGDNDEVGFNMSDVYKNFNPTPADRTYAGNYSSDYSGVMTWDSQSSSNSLLEPGFYEQGMGAQWSGPPEIGIQSTIGIESLIPTGTIYRGLSGIMHYGLANLKADIMKTFGRTLISESSKGVYQCSFKFGSRTISSIEAQTIRVSGQNFVRFEQASTAEAFQGYGFGGKLKDNIVRQMGFKGIVQPANEFSGTNWKIFKEYGLRYTPSFKQNIKIFPHYVEGQYGWNYYIP